MASTLYRSIGSICTNLGLEIVQFCLPEIINCKKTCTDYLITSPDEMWNCGLCRGEREYYVPYSPGAKFMLQTLFTDFYNIDPANPTAVFAGFIGIELCDKDGNVISDDAASISPRRLAGWDGTKSYQLFEIDTSFIDGLIEDGCPWSLRIVSYDQGVEKDFYLTQHFRKPVHCDELISVRSDWKKYDCCGHYYGEPVGFASGDGEPFVFDNTMEVNAAWTELLPTVQKEIFGSSKPTEVTTTCQYSFHPREFLPPFMFRFLVKQIFGGATVWINNKVYTLDSASPAAEGTMGRMINFKQTLTDPCTEIYGC